MDILTETELKLTLPDDDLRRLARLPWLRALRRGPSRSRRLTSTYFDTPDGRLWARGATLRVRRVGGRCVETVKAAPAQAAGLFRRLEWEGEVADGTPDLDAPRAAGLDDVLAGVAAADLAARFTTDVRRTEVPLGEGDWVVKLALDRGTVIADGRETPLQEIELELVAGRPADLYALAVRLAAAAPLHLETRSKAARGHDLALGAGAPAPVKGTAPRLARHMTVGGAFKAIATGCVAQMAANARPLVEARDGEAVHQMRVATRRLRSAMTTFRPVVDGPDLAAVKDELRWLMGALGPARDADVFLGEMLDPVHARFPRDTGLAALRNLFAERRAARFDAAVAAVADPRFSRLLLRIGAWIEAGDWLADPDRPVRDAAVAGFACETLDRRWRKVLKPARKFNRLSEAERHRLRIQVKKLRYTAEFFADLFGRKTVKPFVKSLSALQDQLGALNDVAVAGGTLHDTLAEQRRTADDVAVAAERAWAAGLVAGWHRRDARDQLAEAGRTLEAVRKKAGFWR